MADVVLRPNSPLLAHQLETYAEDLREERYTVDIERGTEARGGIPTEVTQLAIGVVLLIGSKEYEGIKRRLKEWFTEQPRKRRRRVEVHVEDDQGGEDDFVLEEGRD